MVFLCVFLFVYSPALCARKAAKALRTYVCSREARKILRIIIFLRASCEQMFNKHFVALRLSVWPRDE